MLKSLQLLSASALSETLAPQPRNKPVLGATPAKKILFFSFARLVFCQVKPQASPQLGQRGASTQTGEEAVISSRSEPRRTSSVLASL